MRKVSIAMFMTLDGVAEWPQYAEGPHPGSSNEGPPMWNAVIGSMDTLLFGRHTYELWAGFWPGQEKNPSAGAFEKKFSRLANQAEKVVFSKTLQSADWPTSRIVRGDLGQEVARLKSLPGKDIVLGGGPRLAQSLLEQDLADELFVTMFPTIVGKGKPLFRVVGDPDHRDEIVPLGAPGRHDFKMLEARPIEDGLVLLHYARASL
jgi:dihydrofolate reductase